MTIINNSNGALQNSAKKFELSINDANEHDLPDTDGDDSSGGDGFDARTAEDAVAYLANNQDKTVTATLLRKPDLSSSIEVVDVDSIPVESGDTVSLVPFESAPHGIYRVVVQFADVPSGNDNVVVEFDVDP